MDGYWFLQRFCFALFSYLIFTIGGVKGDLWPSRFSTTSKCSLKSSSSPCQLDSVYSDVLPSPFGFNNALYLTFGETQCSVNLTRCHPGIQYSVRDLSSLVVADVNALFGYGYFQNITIISGAKNLILNRNGFFFTATSNTVSIQYTTVPCYEFYRFRGKEESQFCNQPIAMATPLNSYL